ncbi:hypothetical protein [Eoetvoesiella caeni]|nr:hypothetical protein [Eoetvoesiella caeni]MCI2809370.1 hypothetical protein [Eoetvoesiella caeni]
MQPIEAQQKLGGMEVTMAGNWLKLEASTPDKPEVLAITVAMGWDDPDLVVGKLFRAWRWFDEHTIEGNAPRVTVALLDRIIGVSGFASAMAEVGWLVIADDGLSLPNFDRHNGKTAKDRALTAKRVATHKANAKSNADNVTDALPREEKNREDIQKKEAKASSAPARKIELDADGKWTGIPIAQRSTWETAYPALSLDAELAKAAAWILANPKNKKSNYARFLTNWLSRAQDSARPATPSNQQRFDPVAFVNRNRTDHGRNHGTIIDV